jgi:gluconokinase
MATRCVEPNTGKIHLGDGEECLLHKIDQTVLAVLEDLPDNARVVAVGFSTFVMNLIAVDHRGLPIDDEFTLSYACNAPNVVEECDNIRNEYTREDLHHLYQQITGAPIHSAYAIAQLRALYKSRSQVELERIHTWQTLASLCISRWTGNVCLPISYSEASWTGLFHFRECTWAPEAVALLPNHACVASLPNLADFTHYQPGVPELTSTGAINRYWSMFPQLRSAKFYLGIGDGACANIGSKCSTASRIAVTVGTSAAARICLSQGIGPSCTLPEVPMGLFCYRIDRNRLLVGGALTDGGSLIEWLSQLLHLESPSDFEECMNKTRQLIAEDGEKIHTHSFPPEATASKLIVIPFLSGERSTGYRAGATGAIMGLTRDTSSEHLMKAALEGISLRLRAVLELILKARQESFQDSGGDSYHLQPFIVASGKALEVNDAWRQMIADCSGLDVVFDPDTTEGTSRGVATLIASALASEVNDLQLEDEEIANIEAATPRLPMRKYYDDAARIQTAFIDAMTPLWTTQ